MSQVKLLRFLRGMSQFQLRLISGVNATKLSFIENGMVEPNEDEKFQIAKALGVRPEEVWGGESNNEKLAAMIEKYGMLSQRRGLLNVKKESLETA